MRAAKGNLVRRVVFACLFLVFTTVYPYIAWVNNPNENVRTYMTMALVEQHTLSLEEVLKRHGWTNDMALVSPKVPRIAFRDLFSRETLRLSRAEPPPGWFDPAHSTHYSVKGPAVSFMGVPVYWAYTKIAPLFGRNVPTLTSPPEERITWLRTSTFVLRLFVVALPCFFFLVWLERRLRKVSPDETLRLAAVVTVGVGTNYLAYSLMYVSHSLFAVAAFVPFILLLDEWRTRRFAKDRRLSIAFISGFFATLTTLLEYHAFPVTALLCLIGAIVFYRPTRLLAFGFGAALNVIFLMTFQWLSFGNPLTPGHKMMENPSFASVHAHGLFGMERPDLTAFTQISWSKSFGFFPLSPFMVLGFGAVVFGLLLARGTRADRWHSRRLVFFSLLAMGALWITVSAAHAWRGGWTIGPRYLGAAPPFFALLALIALETFAGDSHFRRWTARAIAGGLALTSVLVSGTLSMLYNSLPEPIGRPIPIFAIPALRAGFVPHHAGEWVGLDGTTFFYVIYAALVLAAFLVAFRRANDRWPSYLGRSITTALVAASALSVSFSPLDRAPARPVVIEGRDPVLDETDGANDAAGLFKNWEPVGRDRVAAARLEAERYGSHGPCAWYRLADLQRIVHWETDATISESKAGASRSGCN